jgi:hypothetical protein
MRKGFIKFIGISILMVVGLLDMPIQASANLSDHSIMLKSIYSIVEVNAVSFPSGNTENENKFTLYITEGTLYIKYPKPQELVNGEAIVYNMLGQEITRKTLENNMVNEITLPLQNTCYIVRINYSGKVHTQKVIASNR